MYNASKKILLLGCIIFYSFQLPGQTVSQKLAAAFSLFEKDSQMQSGISSLYVIDAQTGKVVFEKNARVGLAPASTQKIFISACAYEALGKDFTYKTVLGYTGAIRNGVLEGSLYIRPSGDPTLGSWRWKKTVMDSVTQRITGAVKARGFTAYTSILVDNRGWEDETIPGGWVWEDIGNYYGAGAAPLNWHENQYDVILRSGNNTGDKVSVVRTLPPLYSFALTSYVKAAAKGTGDNTIIYFPIGSSQGVIRGTIPAGEESFIVSGATTSSSGQFTATLTDSLSRAGIQKRLSDLQLDELTPGTLPDSNAVTLIHTEVSPPLDSIIYWYLKKSINLYGEALAKTIGFQKAGKGSTRNGVSWIKDFWKAKGIESTELNIVDGSGLSPLNRVTTHAQVMALAYARKQSWFSGFYAALPEYNGIKMKSGTISGVKGFCGYQKAADGKDYIFSFLVNNYNGPALSLIRKMYRVLDIIK